MNGSAIPPGAEIASEETHTFEHSAADLVHSAASAAYRLRTAENIDEVRQLLAHIDQAIEIAAPLTYSRDVHFTFLKTGAEVRSPVAETEDSTDED